MKRSIKQVYDQSKQSKAFLANPSKKGKVNAADTVDSIKNNTSSSKQQHAQKNLTHAKPLASAVTVHSSSQFRDSVNSALDAVLAILDDPSDKTREHYRETFMSKALVLDNAKSQFEASRREKKRIKREKQASRLSLRQLERILKARPSASTSLSPASSSAPPTPAQLLALHRLWLRYVSEVVPRDAAHDGLKDLRLLDLQVQGAVVRIVEAAAKGANVSTHPGLLGLQGVVLSQHRHRLSLLVTHRHGQPHSGKKLVISLDRRKVTLGVPLPSSSRTKEYLQMLDKESGLTETTDMQCIRSFVEDVMAFHSNTDSIVAILQGEALIPKH